MEFYRVFTNKKVMVSLVVILCMNVLLSFLLENQYLKDDAGVSAYQFMGSAKDYGYSEYTDEKLMREEENIECIFALENYAQQRAEEYDTDFLEIIDAEVSDLHRNYPKAAFWYDENIGTLDTQVLKLHRYFITEEIENREYKEEYYNRLDEMLQTANDSAGVSIFNNKFSLESLKIQAEEYSALKNVNIGNTDTKVFEKSVSNEITNLLAIGFVFIFCLLLFYNKDKNVNVVISSCKNGRLTLFINRIAASALLILGAVVLLFLSNVLLYGTIYGFDIDFGATVQSSPLFSEYTHGVTEGKYILIFFADRLLVLLLLFLFIYMLMILTNDMGSLLLVTALGAGGEYLLYRGIAVYSKFSILRIANVFSFFSVENRQNLEIINLFGRAVRLEDALYAALAVFIVAVILVNIILVKRLKTIHTQTKAQLFLGRLLKGGADGLAVVKSKFFARPGEGYKAFISQKYIVVLLILVVLFTGSYTFGSVERDPVEAYLATFYSDYGGELTKETYAEVEKLRAEIEGNAKKAAEAEERFNRGEADVYEYYELSAKYAADPVKSHALAVLDSQIEYIENEKAVGHDAHLLSSLGYDVLFDEENDAVHITEFLFGILLMAYALYGADKNKDLKLLLRSTVGGRNILFRRKFETGFGTLTAMYVAWVAFDVLYINHYFGLYYITAPVQSLESYAAFPFTLNILSFLIIYFILRYVFLMAVYCLMLFINKNLDNRPALIINFMVFIAPGLLASLGLEVLNRISVTNILAFTVNFEKNINTLKIFPAIVGIAVLAAIVVTALSFERKDRKG